MAQSDSSRRHAPFELTISSPYELPSTAQQTDALCSFCRRVPAVQVRLVRITGLLVAWRRRCFDGAVCRECGTEEARRVLAHNTSIGWLGLPAALVCAVAMWQNHTNLRAIKALAASPMTRNKAALPQGPPALLRFRFLVVALMSVTAAVVAFVLWHNVPIKEIDVGMCYRAIESGSETLPRASCDGPHVGQVVSTLEFTDLLTSVDENGAPSTDLASPLEERALASCAQRAGSLPPEFVADAYQVVSSGGFNPGLSWLCVVERSDGQEFIGRVDVSPTTTAG